MTPAIEDILQRVRRLKVFRRGARRAPHKPLLLLIAIGALLHGRRDLSLPEVERTLTPLLRAFAPPVAGRHQPELPYWHLQSDGLWKVTGADGISRQAGGFPRLPELRKTFGRLDDDIATIVLTDPVGTELIVECILQTYFPTTIHEDIMAAVGIERRVPLLAREPNLEDVAIRYRNPRFRDEVLRAYEHQCAATGFRAALGGAYFGCEAAHVRWHAYDGPDEVANGIALAPTMHKLLDAGAWSLTDDRRIVVSKEFTGSDQAVGMLRGLHGRPLRRPLPGEPEVSPDYIRWHRDPELGGVFRLPALPL